MIFLRYFFLFLKENTCCEPLLEGLGESILISSHNMFYADIHE